MPLITKFDNGHNKNEDGKESIDLLDEKEKFENMRDQILESAFPEKDKNLAQVKDWLSQVIQYNLFCRQKYIGIMTTISYKCFKLNSAKEDLFLTRILGWILELLSVRFMLLKDLQTEATSRNGKTSWQSKHGIGLAVNDLYLIFCGYLDALKTHFQDKPYYYDLRDKLYDMELNLSYGRCLESLPCEIDSDCTEETYNTIVNHKTIVYFSSPILFAMIMAGSENDKIPPHVQEVLFKIAHYYETKNDYFELYKCTKKERMTSIAHGKCTWMLVKAFQKGNDLQKTILKESYGDKENSSIEAVKDIFRELKIEKEYNKYEEEICSEINSKIETLDNAPFRKILQNWVKIVSKSEFDFL